jgi:YggT family protein
MDFVIFVINFLFSVVYLALAARAVLPWFPHDRSHPVLRPLYLVTEPLLSGIRLALPPAKIGMDVSAFIMIILFWVAQQVILKML